MTSYFPQADSAATVYGDDAARIIRLLGERFIAENPPKPFVWRTFRTDSVVCDERACYRLDLAKMRPDARVGQIVFAAAELPCARDKTSAFMVTCDGPTQVWLNGEQVFVSNGNQERSHEGCRIQVSLHAGLNRFVFRCERTLTGFGCGFANAMPQWEPCHYLMPWAPCMGEAGFSVSEPVDEDAAPSPALLFGPNPPEPLRFPADLLPMTQDAAGIYALWCRAESSKAIDLPFPALVDGALSPILPDGLHEVAVIGTMEQLSGLLSRLDRAVITPPFPVQGRCTPYLIAGPLAYDDPAQLDARVPGQLLRGADGPVTWRPAYANMALRPYAETHLYGRWTYPLGVTLYGMWQAGHALGIPAFNDYVLGHLRQVTGIHDYALYDKALYGFPGVNEQICWLDALDDCGSFGSMMLEAAPDDPASRALARRIGQYMLDEQPRTADGAFCRRDDTIWADDMYMSGPFLCRYTALTGDPRAIDECAEQLLKYRALLYLPDRQVMSHMRCLRAGQANGIPWSRGNGWVLFTLSELLPRLPQDHPRRAALLAFFNELTEGYLRLQDPSGLWHQLLDGPETYLEASATAMFACAFARGLRGGWFPAEREQAVAEAMRRAWDGLCRVAIDRNGNLYGVCRGSGFSFSRAYYRSLWWNFNDTHGIGIVMLAGVEVLRTINDT